MRNRSIFFFLMAIGTLVTLATPVFAPASRESERIWADGEIWDTVVTPATFKPPNNLKSVDKLYVFDTSGLVGQRPVGEAAPYEKDYNGGRWWVHEVVFTEAGIAAHDPDNDGMVNFELMSDEQLLTHLGLGHFTITPTSTYFVCPLIGSEN